MINFDDLAICRRRGHDLGANGRLPPAENWRQCHFCGMWVRERRVLDEREDDPPIDEWHVSERIERR